MDYRVAMIGVGGMATLYAQALAEIDGVTLVAGSCRTESKGKTFSDQFNCAWYPDYREMLDQARPDFALICTPSSIHLEPALACAERGVNVICTKPLEVTTERCDQMIEASAGIMLAGLYPVRYFPAIQAVHRAAKTGRFGDIAAINTYTPWWRHDDYYSADRWQGTLEYDGGGALINQAIHGIDVMQWLASATMPDLSKHGNPVKRVCAFTAMRGHEGCRIDVEDTAVAIVQFRNGALGQILATTSMYPGSEKRIQISGRGGTAEVVEHRLSDYRFRTELEGDVEIRNRYEAQSETSGASDPLAISYRDEMPQLEAIYRAHDKGEPAPVDGYEARKAVAIIEAIYLSARTHTVVEIPNS